MAKFKVINSSNIKYSTTGVPCLDGGLGASGAAAPAMRQAPVSMMMLNPFLKTPGSSQVRKTPNASREAAPVRLCYACWVVSSII